MERVLSQGFSEEDDDDENIEWVDTDEKEEKDVDDDDKSIDLEKTDDEETDDEFVHNEEMTNAEDADTRNGDEEIIDMTKVDAEKIEMERMISRKLNFLQQAPAYLCSNSTRDTTNPVSIHTTVLVSVISKPSVLRPIPETPSVAPATTLLPPPTVSSISQISSTVVR
ncbi:hypothetical protein Tco_1489788 [Tanacetum coccineum]